MHSLNCQYLFFQRIPNTTRLSLQQSEEALLCLALFLKYRLDCSFFEFIRDSLNYRKRLKFLEILKNHKRKRPQSINTLYSRTLLYRVFFVHPHVQCTSTLVCENSAFFLPGILPGRNKIHRQVEIVSIGGWVILKSIMVPNFTTIHKWMLINIFHFWLILYRKAIIVK